jgi:transposase-like protein
MASLLNQPHFQDREAARQYLEAVRWPTGPICPHCGVVGGHYELHGKAHRPGLWKCKDCREQFTVTVGTVFERSKIPLHVWLLAVHLICSSKKGISSHQLHRTLGVTYKTAWFMSHRIREAFKAGSFLSPMGGSGKIVEGDEFYWGTEVNKNKKPGRRGGARHKEMNKVVALVERKGNVRAFHVPDVTGPNLKAVLVCQGDPKFPQVWELKIPHPVHDSVSSVRTRPALSFSLSR